MLSIQHLQNLFVQCGAVIWQSQNTLESTLWMYSKKEMHQNGHFQNIFVVVVYMWRGRDYQSYLNSSKILTKYISKIIFTILFPIKCYFLFQLDLLQQEGP